MSNQLRSWLVTNLKRPISCFSRCSAPQLPVLTPHLTFSKFWEVAKPKKLALMLEEKKMQLPLKQRQKLMLRLLLTLKLKPAVKKRRKLRKSERLKKSSVKNKRKQSVKSSNVCAMKP